ILISLIGMLCTNIMACGNDSVQVVNSSSVATELDFFEENYDVSAFLIQDDDEEIQEEAIEEEIIEEETVPDNVIYSNDNVSVVSVPVVIATADVNIRDGIDGEILGVLPEGHNLELLEKIDDTHYKVLYYGKEAYVVSQYATPATICDIQSDIVKMFYALEDKTLVVPGFLSESGEDEEKHIDKFECFEVYEELEDSYLVQTADYVGYISKDDLEELNGTYVIIDESNQNLKLYENYEVILDCPVITGSPSTPTSKGAFKIFDITHNRYLVGQNNSYKSWVSIMMNFNGNIGLHDAEHHTDEDGFFHGWRATNIFGGKTYINNGSHGCVNMRYDDVMYVYVHTGIGTIVL
ncbi:MAG: L,D-transpeptidase family protein, partial [Bacilli bacterium]|nr:L,D-transpeptidase family protein [Bacilli bacterium]